MRFLTGKYRLEHIGNPHVVGAKVPMEGNEIDVAERFEEYERFICAVRLVVAISRYYHHILNTEPRLHCEEEDHSHHKLAG